MDCNQPKSAPSKEFQILQHTYLTLINKEEPISIHQIPIPYVANHIFGIKTNPQTLSQDALTVLSELKPKVQQLQQQQSSEVQTEQDTGFDIGEKEQTNEVVKLGIKGMKSLANMSNYLTGFISKKR